MATVASLISQALTEIGVISQGETPATNDSNSALLYIQNMIDAWGADQLTLSVLSTTTITWPTTTSTQTIGASGADITAQRPIFLEGLSYVIPGTSPSVEVDLGPMDRDSYLTESIKSLTSSLPLNYFYQTSLTTALGTIYLWPQPSQSLTLYLYAAQSLTTPTSTASTLLGPPGYQEAFVYQLALRLCNPFGRSMPPALPDLAAAAFARMKRPNNQPGLLGVDPALIPSTGGAYNILSDVSTGWGGH